jgi:LuxR family transcriptional regulator, maltose regulon positive regulatory protein
VPVARHQLRRRVRRVLRSAPAVGGALRGRQAPWAPVGAFNAAQGFRLRQPLREVSALSFRAAIDLDHVDAEAAVTAAEGAGRLTAERELIGFPFTVLASIVLGKAQARRGDYASAIARLRPALDLARGEDSWVVRTHGLLALAEAQQRGGDRPPRDARSPGLASCSPRCPTPAPDPAFVERTERLLKLTPRARPEQERAEFSELSERELHVLRLLPSSLSQGEIAGELFLSSSTVKSHVRSIFRKLGVDARADAVTRARELGLL